MKDARDLEIVVSSKVGQTFTQRATAAPTYLLSRLFSHHSLRYLLDEAKTDRVLATPARVAFCGPSL